MNNGVSWKAISGCALERDTLYMMHNGISWKEINGCAQERESKAKLDKERKLLKEK